MKQREIQIVFVCHLQDPVSAIVCYVIMNKILLTADSWTVVYGANRNRPKVFLDSPDVNETFFGKESDFFPEKLH